VGVAAGKLAAESLGWDLQRAGIQHQWTCSSIPLDEHNARQRRRCRRLSIYFMLAMTVMGEKKEEASAALSGNGGVPAEETRCMVLLEKGTNLTSLSGPI
jgi:hypothetical protein